MNLRYFVCQNYSNYIWIFLTIILYVYQLLGYININCKPVLLWIIRLYYYHRAKKLQHNDLEQTDSRYSDPRVLFLLYFDYLITNIFFYISFKISK